METKGKAILYIATTLDGYIAGENDDLSFLKSVEKEGKNYEYEDYGYKEFIKTIDTMIMGKITYDWVLEHEPQFQEPNLETYIITHQKLSPDSQLKQFSGDLKEFVYDLKVKQDKRVFIVGGTEIISQLMNEKLIDEFYIAIIPIILGSGKLLFKAGFPEQRLKLVDVTSYDTGLVHLHYVLA